MKEIEVPSSVGDTLFNRSLNANKNTMASATSKASIMVVDDHPMVRDGLMRLISQQEDLFCCGQAGTVAETLTAIAKQRPDLLILDLRLKGGDGLELIKTLKYQYPDLRILILSQYEAPLYVERALRAGALGYVVKEQAAEEVLKAIRSVLGGEIYLTRGMAARFLRRFVGPTAKDNPAGTEPLSDRELHVLQLLGSGLSTREIAAELKLSFKTIESHRENIKRKLGLRNASALVHYANDWCREQLSLPPGKLPED
jgi:DNA-binding NarL/FixJ family response regulator